MVSVLFGTQWGDEGKGKWIDQLAAEHDIVARYQGGNNAGHTLIRDDGSKIVLHHLPSGILLREKISVLGAGMVINPVELLAEMDSLRWTENIDPRFLWLSYRAHVISPWHRYLDAKSEAESESPIGTTKKGIGPTYADKAARRGLRIEQYIDSDLRSQWLREMERDADFSAHRQREPQDWEKWESAGQMLRRFACDAESLMQGALERGSHILMEGAQGVLLDLDFGTYPFVTSSHPGVGGVMIGSGFSHKAIKRVIGIGKVYLTRVGEGPFPTEIKGELGAQIAARGHEFGATTGRPRQVGWFDAVAMRYVNRMNGIDELYLNKLDILSDVPELKIAVAYHHPDLGELKEFPSSYHVLEACKPVYKSFPGWKGPVPDHGQIGDLPVEAQKFLGAIETLVGIKITRVGTGPGRNQYVSAG